MHHPFVLSHLMTKLSVFGKGVGERKHAIYRSDDQTMETNYIDCSHFFNFFHDKGIFFAVLRLPSYFYQFVSVFSLSFKKQKSVCSSKSIVKSYETVEN